MAKVTAQDLARQLVPVLDQLVALLEQLRAEAERNDTADTDDDAPALRLEAPEAFIPLVSFGERQHE